ncbi:MAG: bifunctional indole-3-glycerol phosphate synthase/phosphoribosylanthranilate isomerase [Oscillospiraceae bacterium]|nr:bifunctional indole-3-glycerol phosphate synthase/phosphoribosylanthranilate isomerase [Oscillospiraceae bacterium]
MAFLEALRRAKSLPKNIVIPDIKCFSPKEGDLLRGRDPAEFAKSLAAAGAPVLSVVTESEHFHGSLELLRQVCQAVDVPVLRKDFVTCREDLVQTKAAGAAAVLLMYACLPPEQLEKLYREARELGLDVLVETHTEEELARAGAIGARLVGINNRNIRELERDGGNVERTRRLAAQRPQSAFLISESSLMTPEDVRRAVAGGADAALVGTALWQAKDPALFYRRMCRRVEIKFCGVMDQNGLETCAGAGADLLGFVVDYPEPVAWNLKPEAAAPLLAARALDTRRCLVTGGAPGKILRLGEQLCPDLIQLHHRETLQETREIAAGLRRMGIGTIRTIPVHEEERRAQFGTENAGELLRYFEDAGVEAVLIDARGPASAGGAGHTPPLEAFRQFNREGRLPVILAGGITPENIRQTLRESGAARIDVMSGIETAPGAKSRELALRLIEQAERGI